MPKLPEILPRMDPGMGNAGFTSPNVRPAPVADVASGLNNAAVNLEGYAKAVAQIEERQNQISRANEIADFSTFLGDDHQARKDNNQLTTREQVAEYRQFLDQRMEEAIASHQGSATSQARLAQDLAQIRTGFLLQGADEATRFQKAQIGSAVQKRTSGVLKGVLDDPSSLGSAYQSIDAILDDVSAALDPEEEITMRAGYRAQVAANAVEGFIVRGQFDDAIEMLQNPGVIEALPPQTQADLGNQLRQVKLQEQKMRAERQRRLEDAAIVAGTSVENLPMWARAQALGFNAPQAQGPQSNAGKLIADRMSFVSQYGENSPQVAMFDDMLKNDGKTPSLSDTGGIRKEFTSLSKDFVQVRDSFLRVKASTDNPSPASDIALVFNFMKMLDPGSVVREGEFATAQNAAGVDETTRAMFNKILTGERLTDSQRQDFLGRAGDLMRAQEMVQRRLEQNFSEIASRAGINPKDVVVEFTAAPKSAANAQTTGDPAPSAAPTDSEASFTDTATNVVEFDLNGNRVGGNPAPEAK